MVRIRKSTVSNIEPVWTQKRQDKKDRRREFLARTEGQVWDEETQQFVENDNYNMKETDNE